jgi:hypothetical protein
VAVEGKRLLQGEEMTRVLIRKYVNLRAFLEQAGESLPPASVSGKPVRVAASEFQMLLNTVLWRTSFPARTSHKVLVEVDIADMFPAVQTVSKCPDTLEGFLGSHFTKWEERAFNNRFFCRNFKSAVWCKVSRKDDVQRRVAKLASGYFNSGGKEVLLMKYE